MSAPAIYIWIRRTTDWTDERGVYAQLDAEFRPRVELWNRTFEMPYHRFRQELRAIAAANLAAVRGVPAAAWDAIPDGALVLPVDDDDWFAPGIGEVLAHEWDERADGYSWIQTWVEVPLTFRHALGALRRRVFPKTPPKIFCTTNNYALTKDGDASRSRLGAHEVASAWFTGAGRDRVKRIEQRLSVANRTLASMTTMRWKREALTRAALLRKFHRYRRLYGAPVRTEIAWCEPYVASMASLMDRLQVRPERSGPR